VAVVGAGALLNLVQRWLGHAQLSTTAIYADALGEVDVKLAAVHAAGNAHDRNPVPYSFGHAQLVCALRLCLTII
jgi:site-specific recombinase XerD